MPTLVDLWLPIILSAAAAWIGSAVAWMALPHHKSDFKSLPAGSEDALMSAIRTLNLAPGQYNFPDCKDRSMKDPAFKAKLEAGPTGMLNVWPPGAFAFGGKMVASIIFYLVVSVLVAYVASNSRMRGADFGAVFQIAATCAIMAYCLARIPTDICFNTPRKAMVSNVVDGVVLGLINGAIFAWMWPAGAAAVITHG